MSTKIGTLTRVIAIDALSYILNRHMHTDAALDKLFAINKDLRAIDKAFIYEIVFGSLRWLSKMDWILNHMMDRAFISLDPKVAHALRIGTYQIYYMDRVPDRAAVSSTVEAIKCVGVPQAAPFVNAILRRVAKKLSYFAKPDQEKSPIEYYSMQFAHPNWMLIRWYKQMSKEQFEALLINNNRGPKYNLKLLQHNALALKVDDFAAYLLKNHSLSSQRHSIANSLQVESLPKFEQCPAFAQGCYIVQDAASQIVASLVKVKADYTYLDACAAPGGKAIFLWDAGISPKNLTLCDIAQKRLKILRENFARVGLDATNIWHGDVAQLSEGKSFDTILLDAPCSAMGVIRRHPEIKWLRTPKDIVNCAKIQEKLLNSLARCVKIGGELIYSVCSFELEETSQIIDNFLQKNNEFIKISPVSRIPESYKKYVNNRAELLIYAGNNDGLDGFYAVILHRRS